MIVKFEKIKKSFGKTEVLSDINLTIESGKIMCLLGPSGSGKTTMIRILTGAIIADSGTVKIGEYIMPNMKVMSNMGFMPQNDGIYNDISGWDNMQFYGKLYKIKKKKLQERIEELLKLLDLWEVRKMQVDTYSGGMKKRLSLAISLLHEPQLLVLDEPTVGMDPVLRKKVWEEFRNLKDAGKTILVSTHVMDEVNQCDYGSLLYNGKIIESDRVENLLEKSGTGSIEELFFQSTQGGKK